jgi:hypothetical protein
MRRTGNRADPPTTGTLGVVIGKTKDMGSASRLT